MYWRDLALKLTYEARVSNAEMSTASTKKVIPTFVCNLENVYFFIMLFILFLAIIPASLLVFFDGISQNLFTEDFSVIVKMYFTSYFFWTSYVRYYRSWGTKMFTFSASNVGLNLCLSFAKKAVKLKKEGSVDITVLNWDNRNRCELRSKVKMKNAIFLMAMACLFSGCAGKGSH